MSVIAANNPTVHYISTPAFKIRHSIFTHFLVQKAYSLSITGLSHNKNKSVTDCQKTYAMQTRHTTIQQETLPATGLAATVYVGQFHSWTQNSTSCEVHQVSVSPVVVSTAPSRLYNAQSDGQLLAPLKRFLLVAVMPRSDPAGHVTHPPNVTLHANTRQ